MSILFASSEIISLERNRTVVATLVSDLEGEPFGISVVTVTELFGNHG